MWVWFVDWGKFTFQSMREGGGFISIVGMATPTLGTVVKALEYVDSKYPP